jgi:polyisoprenoid-binding protein YceI
MKLTSKILSLAAAASALVSASSAAVETFKIDPVHSSVGFTIRHIVSKVPGSFTTFSGTVLVDKDNMENNSVEATIDVGSVETRNDHRNAHLKSPDFFDAVKFPTITFKSTSWKKTGDGAYDVTGNLTIKDVTKEVVLKTTFLGFGPGMKGSTSSGWEATTTLNRTDFGVIGPAGLGAMVGNDVAITIEVAADTPPAPAAK